MRTFAFATMRTRMTEELVSVIMPTYNGSKYLAASIESILSQTYQNLELLITDDHSSDPLTLQLLKDFSQKDPRVDVVFLDTNMGPGYARNHAIERARGQYIAFCDSDDRWAEDKLEKQLAFMKKEDCALSCTSYLTFKDDHTITGIVIPPKAITYAMLKRDNKVGCLTAIYDIQKLGRKHLMPDIRKRQDWALFLGILHECDVCHAYTEKPLAYYCQRSNSVSSSKWSLVKYNVAIYRDVLGFSPLKSYAYFFCLFLPTYALKILKRKRDSAAWLARE